MVTPECSRAPRADARGKRRPAATHRRRRRLSAGVLVLAFALWAGGCSAADPGAERVGGLDDETVEELDALVEHAADDATDGALAWVDTPTAALGLAEALAEVDSGEEVAEAAFPVASVTKLFTSAVLLQLTEEGLVDLDDPIAEVLPDRAAAFEFGDRITIRHALGHTSGVPDFVRHPDYLPDLLERAEIADGAVMGKCEDLADVDPIDYVAGEASFEPGTGYEYSNAGYLLVGEIIEAVTGDALSDAYRERILEPLGLERTWLACEEEPRAEVVRGYHAPGSFGFTIPGQGDQPFDVTSVEDPNLWAAGGLVSTSGDLVAFARALFAGELFADEATLEAMLETSEHAAYGLGVRIGDDTYGHGGLAAGYGTQLHYDPATETVVVVMVNETAEELPGELASAIGRTLAESERAQRTRTGTIAPPTPGRTSLPGPAGGRHPANTDEPAARGGSQ